MSRMLQARPPTHAPAMPRPPSTPVRDFTPLDSAARALLGYFVYRQYREFLGVLTLNLQRWVRAGLLGDDGQPTALFKRVVFDFNALDLEALTLVCGVNYVVRASHEKANRVLRRDDAKPRVLYLRGYDYEVATDPAPGSGLGLGMGTVDTARFTTRLGGALGGAVRLFMVMSPNDVAHEAERLQRHFYSDYPAIDRSCSQPIRGFCLQAHRWQADVATLAAQMDACVVYVSSITDSVRWELDWLRLNGMAPRTTVVLDRTAIETKALHTGIHDQLPGGQMGQPVWLSPKPHHTAADIDALHARLSQVFTVVTPETFEAGAPALAARLCGNLAPGAVRPAVAGLPFGWQPAIAPDALAALHTLHAQLGREVDPLDHEPIECLPLYLNQLLLRLHTALLLGAHTDAGKALAIYSGCMGAALAHYEAVGRINDRVPAEQTSDYLAVLRDHRDTANHIGGSFVALPPTEADAPAVREAQDEAERLMRAAWQRARDSLQGPGAATDLAAFDASDEQSMRLHPAMRRRP
jgi:hypothetical protein